MLERAVTDEVAVIDRRSQGKFALRSQSGITDSQKHRL